MPSLCSCYAYPYFLPKVGSTGERAGMLIEALAQFEGVAQNTVTNTEVQLDFRSIIKLVIVPDKEENFPTMAMILFRCVICSGCWWQRRR